jgi:signal recognition particle subunit SEC65
MEGLRECPRGLLRTIAYTQLCEAIEKDFGIELPRKTGKEIPKVIDEFIDTRATDPMMEKMAEALNDLTFECFEFFNTKAPSIETYNKAFKVLQEYKEKSNE